MVVYVWVLVPFFKGEEAVVRSSELFLIFWTISVAFNSSLHCSWREGYAERG